MDKSTTKKLEEVLLNLDKQEELSKFINDENNLVEYDNVSSYLNDIFKDKKDDISSIIKKSEIERTYAYQILNGTKSNPGRDKIIKLCIAGELSIKETTRALEISKAGVLYPREKRDAIIIFAINNKLSVQDTNLLLDSYNLESLN